MVYFTFFQAHVMTEKNVLYNLQNQNFITKICIGKHLLAMKYYKFNFADNYTYWTAKNSKAAETCASSSQDWSLFRIWCSCIVATHGNFRPYSSLARLYLVSSLIEIMWLVDNYFKSYLFCYSDLVNQFSLEVVSKFASIICLS